MTLIHPVVRKLFIKKIKKYHGRKSMPVCKTVEKYTQPRSIVNREEVSDTIQKFPNSGQAFKYNKVVRKKLSLLVDQKIFRNQNQLKNNF